MKKITFKQTKITVISSKILLTFMRSKSAVCEKITQIKGEKLARYNRNSRGRRRTNVYKSKDNMGNCFRRLKGKKPKCRNLVIGEREFKDMNIIVVRGNIC